MTSNTSHASSTGNPDASSKSAPSIASSSQSTITSEGTKSGKIKTLLSKVLSPGTQKQGAGYDSDASSSQVTLTPASTPTGNTDNNNPTANLASDSEFAKTASRQGWSSQTPTRPSLGM